MCVTNALNNVIKVPKNLRSSLILYPVIINLHPFKRFNVTSKMKLMIIF